MCICTPNFIFRRDLYIYVSIGKAMPHVIFFKKVNKRSIVNYENENFHKYLLDFKKKLTTDKNVRVSYRRKNNNMGVVGEMKTQLNELMGMMKQVLKNKNIFKMKDIFLKNH